MRLRGGNFLSRPTSSGGWTFHRNLFLRGSRSKLSFLSASLRSDRVARSQFLADYAGFTVSILSSLGANGSYSRKLVFFFEILLDCGRDVALPEERTFVFLLYRTVVLKIAEYDNIVNNEETSAPFISKIIFNLRLLAPSNRVYQLMVIKAS